MGKDVNLNYHKLLTILSEKQNEYVFDNSTEFIVSYEVLMKKLNCNEYELRIIYAPLIKMKEVAKGNLNGNQGLLVNDVGFSAWASEKYKTLYYENKTRKRLRNTTYFSVFVATCLAILSFFQYFHNSDKIQEFEKTVQTLEDSILKIQEKKQIQDFCHSCPDK